MYESFYGLKEKPFSMQPDPGFLYLSRKHQKALTLFEYGLMNHAGFCVISGDIGSGKTTLLRKLLENMSRRITVGMITNTHKQFGELLDWVLSAFDIHEKGLNQVEKHQRFIDFLLEQYSAKKTTLLIVDEAQNMAADKLEELRMLSNINADKDQVLQIILAGQPELKDTLRLPELKQFVQRISVDYHLTSLDEEDTRGYINHRLYVAGANEVVFTDEACDMIYKYSGGTPRLINLLCDTAMVYGFADQLAVIDEDLVAEMILERMGNSMVPLASSEPPEKKVRADLGKQVRSDSSLVESNVSQEERSTDVTSNDFGEKIIQVIASDIDGKTDKCNDVAEKEKTEPDVPEIEFYEEGDESSAYLLEESEQVLTDFSQPNKSAGSRLLMPLLVGLLIFVIAILLFALSLGERDVKLVDSASSTKSNKTLPAEIEREVIPLGFSATLDDATKQLKDAMKAQEKMERRLQEDQSRLKELEEQALLYRNERDKALEKATVEKKANAK